MDASNSVQDCSLSCNVVAGGRWINGCTYKPEKFGCYSWTSTQQPRAFRRLLRDPMSSTAKQSEYGRAKNRTFFRDRIEDYRNSVDTLDTYQNIRAAINVKLQGMGRLLDVGNGGTFDYDITLARELVAVDLFLEDLPVGALPPKVQAKNGSALELPFPAESFDGVLMVMLIHHLIGDSVAETALNAKRAIAEGLRVLSPGGKLIIVESCVPAWFYRFERIVFAPATKLIGMLLAHPATLQFTAATIAGLIEECGADAEPMPIPLGRWLLQYGFRYPSALTPVTPYLFLARKPGR
jgi:SAM-dependent methyltransferase